MASKIETLAKRVAQETVRETFVALGVDMDKPLAVQKDFAFLRTARYVTRKVVFTIVGLVATGLGYAIWHVLKIGSAVAGK